MLRIGSHVGMNGKEMMLGSAKEAHSYGANTFMAYTGAPQNTKRKEIGQLRIEEAWEYMKEHDIDDIVIHAPYIINLANTVKPEIFKLAVEFLQVEIERTHAMGAKMLVLHPGSHVGAGEKEGIAQIVKGLNEVLTKDTPIRIALETMAGKGSELGKSFEQMAAIYDGVVHQDKLGICFDTCHVHDAGYDIIHDFDGVIEELEHYVGKKEVLVFHINDSKNERGAAKDRHANIGFGAIGFPALYKVVHHKDFQNVVKILETPYVTLENEEGKESFPPYKYEIEMLRMGKFDEDVMKKICKKV